jgi:hypothetical protein
MLISIVDTAPQRSSVFFILYLYWLALIPSHGIIARFWLEREDSNCGGHPVDKECQRPVGGGYIQWEYIEDKINRT